MPNDWLFEIEAIILRLIPAYTLELLDECDIERLLPYYFFDYRKALRAKYKGETNNSDSPSDNFKIINGKKYRVVSADKAGWVKNIF